MDSLNNRINIISIQIDGIKNRRNQVLEIENIFFNYNISKDSIKIEDLLKFTNADFSRIMEIMGEENIAKLTEKFDESIEIINLHNSLVGDLDKIPVATQYEESQKWLNQICDVITKHIFIFETDPSENIRILENTISSLKNFTSLFKGGELTTPVFDLDNFHDLLNKSGLELSTKVAAKKAIGQANYNLVVKKTLTPTNENIEINKYLLVYDKKFAMYEKEINKIKEICIKENIELKIDNVLNQINYLVKNYPELKYKGVQNAVICILLKQELDLYEDFIKKESNIENSFEFINNLIKNCEKLLVYSRKRPLKEKKEEKKEEKNKESDDPLLIQGKNIISKAQEIITSENKLLESENFKNREEFYQQALKNSLEDNEVTLIIIIDSIKQSLNLLEDFFKGYQTEPDIYKQKCKELILNISEFIETYDILKKRLNITKETKIK